MSEWEDFLKEAEKAFADAKALEEEAVADIVKFYQDLTDKANLSAVKARPVGTPVVHPDQQDIARDPEPAVIGDKPVKPGEAKPKGRPKKVEPEVEIKDDSSEEETPTDE
jgi:hypothetical protein